MIRLNMQQVSKQREATLEVALAEKEFVEEECRKKVDEAKKREASLENDLANMWVLVAKLRKEGGAIPDSKSRGRHRWRDGFEGGERLTVEGKKRVVKIDHGMKELESKGLTGMASRSKFVVIIECRGPLTARIANVLHEFQMAITLSPSWSLLQPPPSQLRIPLHLGACKLNNDATMDWHDGKVMICGCQRVVMATSSAIIEVVAPEIYLVITKHVVSFPLVVEVDALWIVQEWWKPIVVSNEFNLIVED
ncbi:hypothetical protein Ancab_018914 [Ancistrocladus abbreviatus]